MIRHVYVLYQEQHDDDDMIGVTILGVYNGYLDAKDEAIKSATKHAARWGGEVKENTSETGHECRIWVSGTLLEHYVWVIRRTNFT